MGAAVDEALVEAGPYELFGGGPFGAGAPFGTGKGADAFALVAGAGFLAGGGPGFTLGTPPPTGKPGSIASWPSARAFGIAAGFGTAPPPPPPPPPPPWLKKSG